MRGELALIFPIIMIRLIKQQTCKSTNTMKKFLLLLISVFLSISAKAIIDDSGNYEITIINDESICIKKYLGESSSFIIPTTLNYNNQTYNVTELNGPFGSSIIPSSCVITDIFIPSSITSIKRVIRENTNLKRVIVENGDNLSTCQQCIYYSTLCYVDYIIVFHNSSKKFYSSDWASGSYSFVGAEIVLKYFNDEIEDETIKMYFKYSNGITFNDEKFGQLITAIKNRGTDIDAISEITLNTYKKSGDVLKYNFSFINNPANELAFGAKVIIGSSSSGTTYVSTNPIIPDKVDFQAPSSNINGTISYNRSNTFNWNSVCLPFDIKESDFGNDVCKIYIVTAATDKQINLTRVESTETLVEAGTPCFIYSNASEWTLSLANATIRNDVAAKTIPVGDNYQVKGSFTNETIGTGKYKLNSQGSEFGITKNGAATVTAFRCYIAPTSTITNAPAQLGVNIDEEASITLVPNDAESQKVKLYDLMGRPRKEGSQGIFIKSTR